MAQKKSILGGLKKMLHRDSGKPAEAAPKPSEPAKKKAAASAKESVKKPPTAPPAAAPAAPETAPEAKSEKKAKNQPWYRHRQRW